ncbi:hypothetical protein [Parabacteroides pacaensis]|uniref:hypothetical protein n=1 Tax=Parabacteroides pacaensis TaxID=2086575 RepID=UPI000D10444A|nr:hypothetical protein [Parabacteroides pacaensis]
MGTGNNKLAKEQHTPIAVIPRLTRDLRSLKPMCVDGKWRVVARYDGIGKAFYYLFVFLKKWVLKMKKGEK